MGMFTPAAGQSGAAADLDARVASLQARVKSLEADRQWLKELETRLNQALESAQLPPTPYPSSGTESGGTDE